MESADSLKAEIKSIYDSLKQFELIDHNRIGATGSTLTELVVRNLDEEQIWQQLELQNDSALRRIRKIIDKLPASNYTSILQCVNDKESTGKLDLMSSDENDENLEDMLKTGNKNDDSGSVDFQIEEESGSGDQLVKPDFFNKKEMEAFLDAEDKKEMDKIHGKHNGNDGENDDDDDDDEDEMDMIEEDEDLEQDIDGSKHYRYNDFFGDNQRNRSIKRVKFDTKSDEETDEVDEEAGSSDEGIGGSNDEVQLNSDSEPRSTFEIRQEKLKEKIKSLEKKNLSEKPWQQIGEAWAKNRPENSLLEEYVEFEHTTRLPPMITEETTKTLEDIVRQRIKDKAYDDVERKSQPVKEPQRHKNDLILDQQKSKISLSQIYEQEYLKQHQTEKEEVKNEQHEEVRRLMKELFIKLDALTNYHYTPKLPSSEIKVITNTKSITVEEVAPVALNDADMLAPEEVKAKSRGLIKSTEERTKTDKLRELRRKKKLAKLKAKRDEERDRRVKVPKDKLKMLQKLGKIHKVKTDVPKKSSKSKSARR